MKKLTSFLFVLFATVAFAVTPYNLVVDKDGNVITSNLPTTLNKINLPAGWEYQVNGVSIDTGAGDVTGPGSAGANKVVLFNGTTGKSIKDSGLTLAGTNTGDQDLSGYQIKTGTLALGNFGSITGTLVVPNGGTGAATLTGYVKGNGTSAMTANAAIPSTDVTGLSITSGKTVTFSNTLTFTGTDSSTLTIGTGGTLGTAAYTAASAYLATSALDNTAYNATSWDGDITHAPTKNAVRDKIETITSSMGTMTSSGSPVAGDYPIFTSATDVAPATSSQVMIFNDDNTTFIPFFNASLPTHAFIRLLVGDGLAITGAGPDLNLGVILNFSALQSIPTDIAGYGITDALKNSNNLSELTSTSTARTNLGLGTLATQSGTFSGTSSGTNTGDQTISITGDGTASGSTGALTLAVTKLNGTSLAGLATGLMKNTTATGVPSIAVAGTDYIATGGYDSTNGLTMPTGKLLGRTTASRGAGEAITIGSGLTMSSGTLSATGGGSGTVTTVGSADGSITVTNPTTTPDLAIVKSPKWSTARSLAGNSVDGSADVTFGNKFIVQGTSDAGLSSAQFLGALATGLVKNTTTTGVFSIASAGTDYAAPNSNTTGSAASLSIIGQTGLLTFSGLTSTNRAKTVRDVSDTILELGGTYTPTGVWTFSGGVNISGSPFRITGNQSSTAWTTNGIQIKGTSATLTDTSSSGTVATAYTNVLGGNTIAASSATTFTDYEGMHFRAPVAGTNVTLTNPWALGADSMRVGTSNQFKVSASGVVSGGSGWAASGANSDITSLALTTASTSTAAGAASSPAFKFSGTPFAGTGTTSFPLVYINDSTATASTTLANTGTSFGVNQHGTSDLMNLMTDGVSKFQVSSAGAIINLSSISLGTPGGTNQLTIDTNPAMKMSGGFKLSWSNSSVNTTTRDAAIGRGGAAGTVLLGNSETSTGFTRLMFGLTTNSAAAIGFDATNGFTFQSAAGTATWNDASTANSGTVANRYLVGIAAPTLTATGTSVTYTVANTVYIGGAPTAGTNTTITTPYALNVAGGVTKLAGPVVFNGYTVSTLPSTAATGKVQGAYAFVTDALAPTYGATAVGGGSVVTPVFYDGTLWTCR